MINKILELRQEIEERQKTIDRIQAACSHLEDCVIKDNKGNTGNWDPSQDSYWTEFHSELCDKHWIEEGSK